jgi:uncharacterized protein (DUF488 family)
MQLDCVVTIGVYGFDAAHFFESLVDARVDLFCDLRARRGVRGREYAFANSKRLEARLLELKIEYVHFRELAPTKEIRSLQYAADAAAGVAKRKRDHLSPSFVERYIELLEGAGAAAALETIRGRATRPALFCVERLPSACHRSLVAEHLAQDVVPIANLVP